VLIMMAVWLLLGVAFWSLTSAAHMEVGVLYSTGLFSLAFALGFLVPIAPAGLGIRDGILTLGLLPFGTMGQVLAVTVIARLVYLVVEIGIVVIQETAIALHMRLQTQAD
jgi:uncharacterized membrane protein YbhN (UPF0104 family)